MTDPIQRNDSDPNPKPLKISLWGGILLVVGGLILLAILWKTIQAILKTLLFFAIVGGLCFIAYWWFIGRKNDRPGPL